ncbi:MAG TPA: hypothetical protein VKK31_14665 [Thermoanaerobaculia bacterium]|nr:hypothetical protein [Thermoanaerobaculia bacterium]
MDHHPTPAEMELLLLGGTSAARSRAIVAHLLRGCAVCSARLARYLPGLLRLASRFEAPPPPRMDNYDEVLDRAFAAVGMLLPPSKTLEQKKQEALDLLASRRLEGAEDVPSDLHGLPMYEALLERSWALRHHDPDQMVQFAHSAVLLAERLNEGEFGARQLVDLRCRAWAELGNAYRVADELDSAEVALGRATDLYLENGDNLFTGRFFTIQASYYTARRLFELAGASFDFAINFYQQHRDKHLASRTLIMKGIFLGYRGNTEEAVLLIQDGLASVDESRDPRLVFSALQSKAWFLVDCGRYREARRTLFDLRRRGLDPGGRVNELKLRWLEGHIQVGMEELGRAELTLQEVRQGFEEAGLGYKAALAGLELGAVWLRQRRLDEAEKLVLECADVFIFLRIQREALASVLVARKAAETRCLTLGLLQQVIDLLHRTERDPSARLEPEP